MFHLLGTLGKRFSLWFGQEEPGNIPRIKHPERRQWVRSSSRVRLRCAPAAESSSEQGIEVQAADVCQGGIRLLTDQDWEPGTLLHITPGANPGASTALLACVVHSEQRADTTWLLGCSFIRELSGREMKAFL